MTPWYMTIVSGLTTACTCLGGIVLLVLLILALRWAIGGTHPRSLTPGQQACQALIDQATHSAPCLAAPPLPPSVGAEGR